MKFIIEILRLDGDRPPEVLLTFAHTASSLHMVREAMQAVMRGTEWPKKANGFRIVWDRGAELYRQPGLVPSNEN